ncbi:hypothetical protein [Cellulomonas sp. URHD0024]|uniref:hypothetical protein n=1 Tax=Cellulomonas sp. URHD0024 TaxID=1302620 RepID=UPI0004883443|nr:hypothetical protein [Cellulomonas sp. URHD0024]
MPFTPTGWGDNDGCPAIGVYITPGSASNWLVRHSAVNTCLLKWYVTAAGADEPNGIYENDVTATGTLSIAAHPGSCTRTSGSAGPMGPLVW